MHLLFTQFFNALNFKKFFKIGLYNLGILAFLIIGSEYTLRAILPNGEIALRTKMNKLNRNQNLGLARDSFFDYENFRFIPNSKIPVKHAEYQYIASINDEGWRAPCFNKNKDVDRFLIGDSFIYGIGVKDSDTFSCVGKDLGLNLYTLGIPGQSPLTYLEIIERNKNLINKYRNKKNNDLPKIIFTIFTGNDYTELIDYKPFVYQNKDKATNDSEPIVEDLNQSFSSSFRNFIRSISHDINHEIVMNNRFGLGNSYLLNGIKLLILKQKKDGEFYYKFYDGTKHYTTNTPSHVNNVSLSLKGIKDFIESEGFKLEAFLFIPSPVEISEERFIRDATLRGIKPLAHKINRFHKIDNLMKACNQLMINCLDTRSLLIEDDYYVHDSHIKRSGVIKVTKSFMN